MTAAQREYLPTRASLLERLKNWEDGQSWQDFYDTYWRLIHGVARQSGLTETEAEEVVQETVIAVAHHIRKFEYDQARGSFKGWLLTQTRWQIAAQHRKRQKPQHLNQDDPGKTRLIEQVPDPAEPRVSEDLWDDQWKLNALAVATERVREKVEPRTFQAYYLSESRNWPISRVAKSLGMSRAQVYVSRHRVQSRLKKETQRLAKRESLPPPEALGLQPARA